MATENKSERMKLVQQVMKWYESGLTTREIKFWCMQNITHIEPQDWNNLPENL